MWVYFGIYMSTEGNLKMVTVSAEHAERKPL